MKVLKSDVCLSVKYIVLCFSVKCLNCLSAARYEEIHEPCLGVQRSGRSVCVTVLPYEFEVSYI